MSVENRLKNAGKIFAKKEIEYGSIWKNHGKLIRVLFPRGVSAPDELSIARYSIVNMIAAKLARYCNNFEKGGHQDSLDDIIVYAAMLLELDADKEIL